MAYSAITYRMDIGDNDTENLTVAEKEGSPMTDLGRSLPPARPPAESGTEADSSNTSWEDVIPGGVDGPARPHEAEDEAGDNLHTSGSGHKGADVASAAIPSAAQGDHTSFVCGKPASCSVGVAWRIL